MEIAEMGWTYDILSVRSSMRLQVLRGDGLGEDRHADLGDGRGVGIWVEVGDVGKVDGGAVIHSLEAAAGVEVSDSLSGGRDLRNRTF
jgi:hypothetical protein